MAFEGEGAAAGGGVRVVHKVRRTRSCSLLDQFGIFPKINEKTLKNFKQRRKKNTF